MCPSKSYVEVFTPGTCTLDLSGKCNLCRCNQVKMRAYSIQVGLTPRTGVLKQEERIQTHRDMAAWGRRQRLERGDAKPRGAQDASSTRG